MVPAAAGGVGGAAMAMAMAVAVAALGQAGVVREAEVGGGTPGLEGKALAAATWAAAAAAAVETANGPIRSESVGSCVVVPTTVMATFVLPTQCENKVQMK